MSTFNKSQSNIFNQTLKRIFHDAVHKAYECPYFGVDLIQNLKFSWMLRLVEL